MRFIAKSIAVLLLTVFTSSHADVPQALPDNPYAKTYVSHNKVMAKAETGPTQIFTGNDKVGDYQRQLEKGYDLLGYSSFKAGKVGPEKLAEQAALVNADVALVYTMAVGKAPASLRLDKAKAGAAAGENGSMAKPAPSGDDMLYSYFASYWTRLPPPVLGVHVQGTVEARSGQTGLAVRAVIDGSPAAAVLRKDDVLLSLGKSQLEKPEALSREALHYAGQTVDVVFERQGEVMRKPVTLGSRR
jgi:hypothetical protein